MPRIFLSHSSEDNAEVIALRDWLAENGWKNEVFLDLDSESGLAVGERWERALNEAANRCEAVLFLVSKAWLGSGWCLKEFNLAHKLNKRMFGVLIEDFPLADLPVNLTSTWQTVRLAAGRDHIMLRAVVPITHEEAHVTFSAEGLARLKHGLEEAGLDPKYFAWPPTNDSNRPPYRGLRPLEREDAGIFFGRDGPIIEVLDTLRGLRDSTPPRLAVILGASGAGKSSFLRAGLFPRLARDDRNFLPLPAIRPERAVISGETGLLGALEGAFAAADLGVTRADLRMVVQFGAAKLKPLLQALVNKATPPAADDAAKVKPPTLVLSIDQAEELFLAEAQDEAKPFLMLLRDLVKDDAPSLMAIFTIRSDNYERLQLAPELEGMRQDMLSLPTMPKGSYAEVIRGPARRLNATPRSLAIEDRLVDALLADIEAGGAKDALPLLAFTLERLYGDYHSGGSLKLSHYEALGRVKGSIEAAIKRAFNAADADSTIPRDRAKRLDLLRRGLIPWLAGIDPETGAPRRRIARLSEIPVDARPLIHLLVEQRLLATDVDKDTGEATIEPAHEALLRQWGLLGGWLTEDAGLLAVLEGIKRAGRDWAAHNRNRAWLSHHADRLAAAERLSARPDLAASLDQADRAYVAACRKAEMDERRGKQFVQAAIYGLAAVIILGLVGVIYQASIAAGYRYVFITLPYAHAQVWPYVLKAEQERALKPGDSFRECARVCPTMVIVPSGSFIMGSDWKPFVQPPHKVVIPNAFAVSKYEITFADWNACVDHGGCNGYQPGDEGWGNEQRPLIYVSWYDAQAYVAWLREVTGKPYRLLTEAEYEYAARAGTTTAYPWGDDIIPNVLPMANCDGCGGVWAGNRTAPVGSFPPNKFGLYDMVGNVWEWTQDCWHGSYKVMFEGREFDAPADGSAWLEGGKCGQRVTRGGAWNSTPYDYVRSDNRAGVTAGGKFINRGFRIARSLRGP